MINGIVTGFIFRPAILRTALFCLFSCFRITLCGNYKPERSTLSINICSGPPHAKSPERNCPGFSASQYKEAHQMDLYIKRAVRRTIRPNELLLLDYTRRPVLYRFEAEQQATCPDLTVLSWSVPFGCSTYSDSFFRTQSCVSATYSTSTAPQSAQILFCPSRHATCTGSSW